MTKHNRLLSMGLALLLLISAIPAVSAAETVHWSGTYMSPDNNTVTTAPIPTNGSVMELAWSADVGNSTVAIIGDYVYTYNSCANTGEGTIYKINKDTGTIAASRSVGKTSSYYYSYMVYGGGLLYVSIPEYIMAFDPDTLQPKWTVSRTKKDSDYCPVQYINGYVVSNGTVLDAATGADKATLTGSYHWANGAEVGSRYYVATSTGKLYAFNTGTWAKTDELDFGSGNSGAGVMHYNGRLYWTDQVSGKMYLVKLNDDGTFNDSSLITTATNYIANTTPVAFGSRVYVAGTQVIDSTTKTGVAAIVAYNALTLKAERTAILPYTTGHKFQSTPLLRKITAGGAEIAGTGTAVPAGISSTATTTVCIYVQDYATPGKVYCLQDDGSQTSGGFTELLTPQHGQYAWEQLACDSDGALYITTDAGYLMKYQTTQAQTPVLTNDATSTVTYKTGQTAEPLTVQASVSDGGKLTYQWQVRQGSTFVDLVNENAASFTPPTDTVGSNVYHCVVTNTRAGTTAQITSKNTKVIVEQGVTPGDVNTDGTVNGKDVTCLTRHLAGWEEADYHAETANVNGDDVVDVLDLVMLRRHVSGWNVQLQSAD